MQVMVTQGLAVDAVGAKWMEDGCWVVDAGAMFRDERDVEVKSPTLRLVAIAGLHRSRSAARADSAHERGLGKTLLGYLPALSVRHDLIDDIAPSNIIITLAYGHWRDSDDAGIVVGNRHSKSFFAQTPLLCQ